MSRDILKAQTKINKRTEFINWVQSTKESIEQMTSTNYHFDKLAELESLQNDLNVNLFSFSFIDVTSIIVKFYVFALARNCN